MDAGISLVPFARTVHTVVARVDAVSVHVAEPPNSPLFFVDGMERFDFLLRLTFFGEVGRRGVPGRGSGGGRGSTSGSGGRKIVQLGLDHFVLVGGGGGELLERGVSFGGSQRYGVKMAFQMLNERLAVPPRSWEMGVPGTMS